MSNTSTTTPGKSPAILVVVAWLIVGVPACWGVYQTLKTSVKLFQPQPTTMAVPKQ